MLSKKLYFFMNRKVKINSKNVFMAVIIQIYQSKIVLRGERD